MCRRICQQRFSETGGLFLRYPQVDISQHAFTSSEELSEKGGVTSADQIVNLCFSYNTRQKVLGHFPTIGKGI